MMEEITASSKEPFANVITGSKANNNLFCCVCRKSVCSAKELNAHLRSYRHKIFMERCKSVFEDRGEKVFCKTCKAEIEWIEIEHHGLTHRIPPWCKNTKPSSKTFFHNRTAFFGRGYYFCYLCERFLDYWDTASSHFMEADHQDRKEKFGTTVDLANVDHMYAIANGIVPGRDMTNECKICDKTGLEDEDIEEHTQTAEHKRNSRKTAANIFNLHKRKQNSAFVETSFLEDEESTFQLLEVELPKKDNNSENIEDPENRDMIFNYSLYEYKETFANKIVGSRADKNLFCCVCSKALRTRFKIHTRNYGHRIRLERCKLAFEDRGKNVFCKICSCEIEWKEIVEHGKMHRITPWSELTKPSSETFYRNHTVCFAEKFCYCYLCEKFLDYWDTASSHFMEADHQERRKKFDPTDDSPNMAHMYAITDGIVPGRDMTNECKMCDKTGLKDKDIQKHLKTGEHKENARKTVANMFKLHETKQNSAVLETSFLETKESTFELLDVELPKKDNNSENIEEPESRDMIFNFSLYECKETFANKIVGSKADKNLFCCVCSKALKTKFKLHTRNYGHRIRLERCKLAFEDRWENVFCKICSCEIEWKEIVHHGEMHGITPWSELTKPSSETFYRNHTVCFAEKFCYCYLCEKLLDYWDTASSHFMEADHQDRKEKFGTTVDLSNVDHMYAITNGIVPGRDMTNECKMCDKTGLEDEDIEEHSQTAEHIKNAEKTAANIFNLHTRKQNSAISETSFLEAEESTSELLKVELPKKDNSSENIEEPESRDTIYNFNLQEDVEPNDLAYSNKIIGSNADKNLFCCVCRKSVCSAKELNAHLRSNRHKIFMERCKSVFEDRGEKVFCKTCKAEIEWIEIEHHGLTHRIPPWCEDTKPCSKTFFHNRTAFFRRGFYFCYLCERFLDYWDTASSHFMEADHQDRKEKFGTTVDLANVDHMYAIANGIVPGRDMTNECKICDKTGLEDEDIEEHTQTAEHKRISRKTAANIFKLHEIKQNSAVLETSFLETEESTFELLEVELPKKDNNSENIEEPESRDMIFNFSLYECKETFANKIVGSKADKNLFCCVCSKALKTRFKIHTRNYGHRIRLERCKLAFEDRWENVFCKICSCEIEWKEIVHHGEMHGITPWSELTKPSSETFYRNHTVRFADKYCYCYLCEKFLDYWDTASSHFMEADHQDRKEKFGTTVDLSNVDHMYAITNGIVPGRDMTNECKMCDKTGLEDEDIEEHSQTAEHIKNAEKTAANIFNLHTRKQNSAISETSFLEAEESTSELLKVELPKKDNSSENIEEPESRDTIYNFNLQEDVEPNDLAYSNKIIGSNADKNVFCCVCSKSLTRRFRKHTRNYVHKICLQRCKLAFEDRGKNVFCKICCCEIEWKEIVLHGVMHEITPWSELKKPNNQTFYRNHTVRFADKYCYCYLCEKFLDYWDTASSHFKEADHQDRRENFGPTLDSQKTAHVYAVTNGIVPGRNMTNECKMCEKTGLKDEDIAEHVKTTEHKKNAGKIAANIFELHESGQNSAVLESKESTSNLLEIDPPEEDDGAEKIQSELTRNEQQESRDVVIANVFRETERQGTLFCCACCNRLKNVERHQLTYQHKIFMKRFKTVFQGRGEKFYCKRCNSEIEWKEIEYHAKRHKIAPWDKSKKPNSQMLFQNHTIKFCKVYICFLCEIFLDYWDTASSHFMEAVHLTRKRKFGPTEFLETNCVLAVTQGIVPGKDMMNVCKMCNLTIEDIKEHIKTVKHKENRVKFRAEIARNREERENGADSQSNSLDTEESTSKLLRTDALAKENKPKNIKVPYSRSMICNFSLQENPEESFSERKESSEESGNVCRIKAEKSGASITMEHEKRQNYADSDSNSSEFEEPICDVLTVEPLKEENNFMNIEEPEIRNMIFSFSLQESYNSTREGKDSPTESGNVVETFHSLADKKVEPSDEAFANKIIVSKGDKQHFCCVCGNSKTKLAKHLRNYGHKIRLERCEKSFEDRGENVFCQICSSEIEWKEIVPHAEMHEITPWNESTKPSGETFYRNRTVSFSKGFCYCYLCERFFDYWDTASSHLMEADHQKRKEEFGPTADLEPTEYAHKIYRGILPGPEMTYECKMCDKTGLKTEEITRHVKTKAHRISRGITSENILNKHKQKQNFPESESNRNMTFHFSLQESPKMTPKENESAKESGNADETFHPSSNVAFVNANVGSRLSKKSYCSICRQFSSKKEDHLNSHKHKVYQQRFESVFEDRGENFFCKICTSEIEWKAIKDHGVMHQIPPWAGHSSSAKYFFENHTAKFAPGYCYCFLCKRFLDYWDTAASHFKEADHQKRKLDFGRIVHLHTFSAAVAEGFAPGKDRMFECKMCHVIGSKVDIKQHSKTKNHKKNLEKFTTALIKNHEEGNNLADSGSEFLNTASSTSNPVKSVPQKEDNLKKIQVPYNRNMICNFTLQENPDKEIPEEKESAENNQTTDETEFPKLSVEGKPPESAAVDPESINQNENWPIKYIVSSTSDLCKMAIVGTDMQRKRKIAKQNTEEPDPYCLICYSEIPGYAAVQDHLKGRRHETARQKYGCDNILLIEGEHYWCSACDGPVSGFNNVYRHITSNSHLSAIVRIQSNNQGRQNNPDQVENLMEVEESLPCLYIVKRNAKKSFCQICDETQQHPVATKNINDHIASQRHKIALKRYGCDNIVPKGNDNYYCKCCLSNIPNIESLYLHIKDKKHMSSLIKVCSNEGQRGKRRIESQMLNEDLNKPFQNLLSNYITQQFNKATLSSEEYETWQYSLMSNFNVDPNHTDRSNFSNSFEPPEQTSGNSTASLNLRSFGFMSAFDFTEVKRKTEESYGRGQKLSALEHEAQTRKFYCNVCGASAEDTTELHVHMASHYAEEFVRLKSKKMRRADQSSHQTEQATNGLLDQPEIELDDKIPNGVAMNDFSRPTVEFSNGEIGEISSENDKTELVAKSGVTIQDKGGRQKMKRSGKRADMRKVSQLLDFDEDHIYDLDDKMEEVELGMMLGLVVDSSKMYCLICRSLVEYTLDNYYEHLENIDHCQYLEEMEADDALFQDLEDQFSDLALAKEYMEETSRDKVRCVICGEDVKNNARSLQAHIYHEIHERKCEETRAIARRCFEKIKPRMTCDWYEVQKYWCVICQSNMESEVKFVQHLNDKPHKKAMRSRENRNKRLFFDFCVSCAVLWYGYRCTHSYHNNIDSHKWLQRDGHYVLTELPKLARSLLAAPEDFADDKIKFLDEVAESELEREKLMIQDLEKAAKMRFPRSKAHLFGSRISGLGSPDSDIDVFLDCRNFYDGHDLTNEELLFFINGVHQCLCKDPQLWDVDELLTECRIPIIKATHRATELSCDISFENGLSVENTKLIRAFNQVFPTCRKLTLFLKQWLLHCGLSGSRGLTSYALYWFVIFYLQQELILPSVERLIAMRRRSHIIAGWEVGVTHNFNYNEASTFTFKDLLTRFFIFYANFNFRYNVACPLLGEVVEKREFVHPQSLPRGMERYIAYMRRCRHPEPFRIDSPMCIQDPFDLQHNLTKAVNKVYLNRFRKCCEKSSEILRST